jgi:protein-S-isoprenylcysteine O-methyltransferase Ste14
MAAPLRTRWARVLALVYALGAAALFPTSLLSGVWLYLSLGSPADPAVPSRSPAVAVAVNVLLFGLFALHHSLLARTHAKVWLSRVIAPALERSTYVLLASLLFLLLVVAWQPVPGVWYRVAGWPAWLLLAAQFAGIGLTLLAAKAIDPFELAGVRQALSLQIVRQPGDARVTSITVTSITPSAPGAHDAPENPFTSTGAYGLVRHPIYLGWLLMVWPTPTMTSGRLTFAAISSAYLVLAIPWEERSLLERYGAFYQHYCDKVRWRIVPGVY